MTRQRVYQRRHRAQGLCMTCSRPALSVRHCARHLLAERERRREASEYAPWKPGGRGTMPVHTDDELRAVVAREDADDSAEAFMLDTHRAIMFRHFMGPEEQAP